MGFTKALYYPTIDIQNEEWLKSAVLFWDEINTIVPESIREPYKLNSTKYLADEGILNPVPVSSDRDFIEELTNDTLNYLNSNEGFQLLTQNNNENAVIHRDKLPRDVRQLFDIHPEKLPYEIRHQLRDGMTDEGWLRVNGNFGAFYMTLLANKICEEKGIALLTDNPLSSNLSDKVKLDNQVVINGRGHDHYDMERRERYLFLAQGMLTNLIVEGIKISPGSSLTDVIQFRKKHRDELGLFRTNISKLTQAVSKEGSFEAVRQQVNDIYNDEFLPSYNNLKRSLNGSGVKWLTDNFMKVAFVSTSATALPMALLGLALPQALIAGAGISLVTSVISYNEDKKEKIRNNPYSYLLAINKSI